MKAGKALIIYKTVVVTSYQPTKNCNLYKHSMADLGGGGGSMGPDPHFLFGSGPPFFNRTPSFKYWSVFPLIKLAIKP